MASKSLERLLSEVRACQLCAKHLPLPPKPILHVSPTARLLIVGQAPGLKVHNTGIPWNDPSGDRLRDWLQMSRETFYDARQIAIIPTGLCYPGKGPSGDLPPRPECAPRWHPLLRAELPKIKLTLLVGAYAQAYYLGPNRLPTLSETVRHWRNFLPDYFPLPHPSPRNRRWLVERPWFESEVLPSLREWINAVLNGPYPPH